MKKSTGSKLVFFSFLTVFLGTIIGLKIINQKHEIPKISKQDCLKNIDSSISGSDEICTKLSESLTSLDFKISESSSFDLSNFNQSNTILTEILLPVVDFYSPLSDISQAELKDAEIIKKYNVELVDFRNITSSQKVISLDQKYFLDDFAHGAKFITWNLTGNPATFPAVQEALKGLSFSNPPSKSNVVSFAETGVTALSRRLTYKLGQVGGNAEYFTEKIKDFLSSKTYTHISNEVSFADNCQGGYTTTTLCADWKMMGAITSLGTDIVELTGNHNNDYGAENNIKSIAAYREKNLKIVGGGENLAAAKVPLDVNDQIKLFAFNHSTSSVANGQIATENSAGANPYNEEEFKAELAAAKAKNKFVIVNVQYFECYAYPNSKVAFPECDKPIPNQKEFFRHFIDLGADMVVGTSAHQPQTYELYKDKPIYYGLGNLFFDQISWPDTMRSLILTHYFYQGKYLQTRISPTLYDENFQTYLIDEPASREYLRRLVYASPKGY